MVDLGPGLVSAWLRLGVHVVDEGLIQLAFARRIGPGGKGGGGLIRFESFEGE